MSRSDELQHVIQDSAFYLLQAFGPFEEDIVAVIGAYFDFFSMLEEDLWVLAKSSFFFLRIEILVVSPQVLVRVTLGSF